MEKLYTIENLRLCWDFWQDGHAGLEGNPESFDEWLEQTGLHPEKVIAVQPDVIKSVCKHPKDKTIEDKDHYLYCTKCQEYYSM